MRVRERERIYILAILVVFLLSGWVSYKKYGMGDVKFSLLFLSLGVLFEFVEMRPSGIGKSSITVSGGMLASVMAAFLLNPFEALIVSAGFIILSKAFFIKKLKYNIDFFIFNFSQIGLSAYIAAVVMKYMSQLFPKEGISSSLSVISIGVLSYILANIFFVSLGVSISKGQNLLEVYGNVLYFMLPNLVFSIPVLLIVIYIYEQVGLVSIPLSFLLLLVAELGIFYRKLYEESKIENFMILAKSLEERDQYTYGHSKRVAEYSVKIAEKLGIRGRHLERIKTAALLHDIGKIAVPDYILNKPGKLSFDEYEKIKIHPVKGWELLSTISRFKGAEALWVKYHHEKPNGEGYPEGLRDKEIPLEAKIIAVADIFEALTSNRPYRKALSVKEAISVMEDMAKNSEIDPKIFEVFKKIIKGIGRNIDDS